MRPEITAALARDRTVDITTTGARSGQPRRIEIWFHQLSGRVYISGLPGRRGWYANLLKNPDFTFHLKESAQADLPARAHPVTVDEERRRVLEELLARLGHKSDLEDWQARSPIIEVEFLGEA
jgi:hypothetical protein